MKSKNVWHADNQQASGKISDEYFSGFVDGEGCFYVGFSKRLDLPLKWQVITEFHLSQNPGGRNVLQAFRDKLGCGYIKPNHAKNPKDHSWVLVIKNRQDIEKKLIPFFNKHPLYSKKWNDFQVFCKVIELIKLKKHLSREGLNEIISLVFDNTRITNKRYLKEHLLSS